MSEPVSQGPGRPLRIGIDARELEGRPTGVGRYLRSLLRRFATHDRHHFMVYSTSSVSVPTPSARIETRVLPGGPPLLWEQRALPAAILRDRIDVLLSPAYSCPLFSPAPRVTAIHDLSFFARPDEFGFAHGLRRRLMARWSARVSSSILACSQFTKGEVRRYLGRMAADRTAVVLLGPDDDLPSGPERAESRSALGLPADTAYIITVGTVLRRRNVSTLVRAAARLGQQRPNLRLGIVGENRSHPWEDLQALVKDLGAEGTVRVSGFVTDEEVARHYAAADVAVFLSEYEGFGLPALEAMSRGVPTIIAARGSLNEMFAPGALVVEPEAAAVARALARVLDEPGVGADLKRRGSERAMEFSWERAARETLAVLERAAS
ncbi:MAG: glycosyltransferase family 4 protein [Vicinamibacteria bacterium]|nr:glycosyltransferase family 4 protein [Vicinamibacteria bacterium]